MNDLQRIKFHNFGVDTVTGGTLTDAELDTQGASSLAVILQYGAIGTSGITVVSVHASDTSGFTPDAGNKVSTYELTGGDLPADADDNTIDGFFLDLRAVSGRYVQLIVTAGAQACDIAALGILGDLDEVPGTASARGLRKQVIPAAAI